MVYSSAGILTLIIYLIINKDVLGRDFGRKVDPALRHYRVYLISVMLYLITDALWGILYEREFIAITYADTVLYFIALAASILLWTRYVIVYLKEEKSRFAKALKAAGLVIFSFQIAMVIVNFFVPVMFWFDRSGAYQAGIARYAALALQILLFLLTAVYALRVASRSTGTIRVRHHTIGIVSLVMAVFITLQALFPLLPMFAIGYLLASCMLHTFVLENEKEEYRDELEKKLQDNVLKGNYYDLLTGLPGMTYFFELAEKRRHEMVVMGESPTFLFINLSGMKFYNQKNGFDAGNDLLWAFAQMLIRKFGKDNCSRFGQDHFVVFTDDRRREETVLKMFDEWEEEHGADAPAIRVGIYRDIHYDDTISTACDRAKAACDDIRKSYISSVRYYDEAMLENAEKRQYITTHLDQAIAAGWIQVYYQPIVRATNGWICDEEALSRWVDPRRGFLSPAEFIPALEEAGLVYKLDLFVLEQVLEKLKRTQAAGLEMVPQSINLSRADFDACDIVEEVRCRVDEAGIPRKFLNVELTESIVGSDFEFMKEQIGRFRELGFSVWMDDFGSGYSSLDVLQTLPVDLIKFDMRFMQQLNQGGKSKVILTELMKMTIGLGIDTLCEGVEREDQMEFLREIGCDKLQGFYYTQPIREEEMVQRYRRDGEMEFENPQEAYYYDAIGRINLYDMTAISDGGADGKDDTEDIQRYFNTIPMAIIEVRGNKARFTRSNQTYRDFMEQMFGVTLKGLPPTFEETPEGPGMPFVLMLRKCCAEGGRAIIDETMPDGTTVHSFMRMIAENPKTGTTAAVVAVLSVNRPAEKK